MGKNITDDDIIKHKKNAIKQLNNMFEAFINSPNPKHKKKADLIAYWMEKYSQYLLSEQKFDYRSIPKYKRGEIVSVNFGFNVGSEHGGLHYAIVLDNDNKQSSPVLTVIPLSSGSEENTYERDVFLGSELYDKLNAKYNKLISKVESELLESLKVIEALRKTINNNSNAEENLPKDVEDVVSNLKQRIYKPKNSSDLLYQVKFSDGAMDKINEKLKELFVYGK